MSVRIPAFRLPLPRRAGKPVDDAMSVMDHLNELRRRLFFAVVGVLSGTVIGFLWFGHGIPAIGLPSLAEILTGPYCAVPAGERLTLGDGNNCRLLATGPFSAVELQLKSALIAGAVLSCPVWLFQIWRFLTPALHTRERRYAVTFVGCGALLFTSGAVLAYVVIEEGLTVLLGFGGDATITALTPESYFSFLIAMLIIFGVSFELPLLLIMVNQIGLISHAQLKSWRRYSFFAMVVFAGLVVPGNDPVTMGALAVALVLLYELSVQVTRVHDKRVEKRRARAPLSDSEVSSISDPTSVLVVAEPEPSAGSQLSDRTSMPSA